MSSFWDILTIIFVGSLVVLVIMNPKGFSADVSSAGGFITSESTILTGSGYKGKGGG